MNQREIYETNRFAKDKIDVPQQIRKKLTHAASLLQADVVPDALDIKKMEGYKRTRFRVRLGDYRLIYSFDSTSVYLLRVGHRKDIYE